LRYELSGENLLRGPSFQLLLCDYAPQLRNEPVPATELVFDKAFR
jgi:hypothetical protein